MKFWGIVLILFPFAAAAEIGPVLSVAGVEETVFAWEHHRCATWDIPDAPARAWRREGGGVALVAGAEATRALLGPSLDRLQRDCRMLHRGEGADDPAEWNDRTWIAAIHTDDGKDMVALGHMEYHGHLRSGDCPSGLYSACWYNAVVELRSTDGGRTFRRKGGSADLVAALPQPYQGEAAHRMGYFNPSNILRDGGFLYAFFFAEAAGPQRRGPCLIRRPVAGGPGDWRAWDGTDFTVRFIDPYVERDAVPAEHVCHPVEGLRSTVSSVVRHERSGQYIAVTPMRDRDGTTGVFWARSTDLVRWSEPRLLMPVPLLWHRDCTLPAVFAYPSLIDPDSRSRTFATMDDDLWLYLTRMPLDRSCGVTAQRDLVRLPLHWQGAGSPLQEDPEGVAPTLTAR